MVALHGYWSTHGVLCLWGEDPYRPVKSPSQALRSARPHPFAASSDRLTEMLGAREPVGKAGEAALWLPSLRTSPLDSPELVRLYPRPAARSEPALLAWTVPVLHLEPGDALRLIRLLRGARLAEAGGMDDADDADREAPADEEGDAGPVAHASDLAELGALRIGASLRHLIQVADLARDLVRGGRVLPALRREPEGGRAFWRPVLAGADLVALHGLASRLPPVGRAEIDEDAAHPPDPYDVTNAALHELTDATARARFPADLDLVPPRRGRRPRQLPAQEAWLAALTAPDGRVEAADGDLTELAEWLAPWDDVGAGSSGPARLLLRLGSDPYEEDPDAGGDAVRDSVTDADDATWQLDVLLQAVSDPSLQVTAEQVWQDTAYTDALARWLDRPQELLLRELGRACELYPRLADALRTSRPARLELSTEEVVEFLSVAAPRLDEAGFGLQLPSWWTRRTARLGLSVSATRDTTRADSAVAGGGFGREQVADFAWGLAVGDETLTEEEIEALSRAKAPLVRLRGQWVAVDRERLRRGLEFLQSRQRQPTTVGDLLELAAAHPEEQDTPLPVTALDADGELGELLAGRTEALTPVEPPEDFAASLRPYQQRGLDWLGFHARLGTGACLADDMGLGKTVQVLALEASERSGAYAEGGGTGDTGADEPDGHPGPTLLICPMSLVGNWQRETEKFAPGLRFYAHHGRDRLSGPDLEARLAETDLVATTYTTATRDIDDLASLDWHRVVLDEAQAVKNSRSHSARAVRRLQAGHRIALTGTPMENRLTELWSVMDAVNPGLLGSSEAFRKRYAIPIERHGETEGAQRLRTITQPYLLRRVKTDPAIIDDLPDKVELTQHYKLTLEQASLYRSVVDDMLERIEGTDGIERRGNVLSALAKLKQICNHPAQLLHDGSELGRRSGKVLRLLQILDEIVAEGAKVLCFTQFTEFAELLLPQLSARYATDVLYLHGQTPKKRRDEMVERFAADDGPPIFLLSLKAGGTGLNLTAATHVVHLDRWWNPAVEDQATDRAFRIGQQRNVTVHKFLCPGTLEERIDQLVRDKKALTDMVVSDGEGWLTELSGARLRELFALDQEAVDE